MFRRYAPYVGALVLRLVGRPADVDDVVQDVFIQAHRDLARLRDPAALRPWLRRITVRRARRWLRTRWVRRRDRETDVDAHTDLVDAAASPEERAEIARIYRMLDRMPRDERLVWVLRFVEGETLESIAGLLGASVSTVQRRLRAAELDDGNVDEGSDAMRDDGRIELGRLNLGWNDTRTERLLARVKLRVGRRARVRRPCWRPPR